MTTTDFETANRLREWEDRRRGYSIMGASPITHVDGKRIQRQGSSIRKVLDGLACRYDVVHEYKGRRELFERNCFVDSLWGVFFGIDHKFSQRKLGDQDDGTLELLDCDIGLAFRLTLAPGDVQKLDGRDEASVAYLEENVEVRNGVRVIKRAALVEVSAVHVGAIRQTHCLVRDADKVGPLADDVKSFQSDGAATKFLNALRRLQ